MAIAVAFGDGDQFKSQADMIKAAEKYFEEKNYVEAVDLYSQLVSLEPNNPNYNYKYGTCLIYAGSDKEEALKFLKIAVSKNGVDPMAYYFLGKAYQLNYYFKEAIKAYNDFKFKAPAKVAKEYDVEFFIKQCEEGKAVIQDIQSIKVLSKKDVSRSDFFRSYELGGLDRKINVKPDEFKTKLDLKNKEYSFVVTAPTVEEVYISSYGNEKGETGKDIYKVVIFADKTKSQPMKLGPEINTSLDEDYPYLHPNGRVLYFASKGHNSLGGYDIYKSELDTNTGVWGQAVNLGFAVNSPDDDILYITDMSESVAYFASSRASAKGMITVYKIVPNKEHIENTIIKGELLAEGAKKNATITVTNAETGELVGVFKSNERSGAYSITLKSNQKYKFSVLAQGYAPHEELVTLPSKKAAPIIKQKIQLKKTPAETMVVVNEVQTVVDEVAFSDVFRKSASLDVNTNKDVAFNSQPVVKAETTTVNKSADNTVKNPTSTTTPENTQEPKKELSTGDLVTDAYEEAAELDKEYSKLKEEAEAADYVYRVKNDEANEAKQEIVDLTHQLNQTTNAEEKKKIQGEIDNKIKELRKKAREASITEHYAQQKKAEMKNKKEEAEAAKQYADVIKEATNTKNSDQAIAKLEAQKQKLEEIQERNEKTADASMEQSVAATKASKEQEIQATETEIKKIDEAIKMIEADQKNYKKKISETKSQQVKDELTLQLNETQEELAAKQSDKMIAEAKLAAIKSESTENTQETQVVANLQQQINTVKTQDVSVLEAERKKQQAAEKNAATQQKVSPTSSNTTSTSTVPNTKEDVTKTIAKLDTVGKKDTPAEKYNEEMNRAQLKVNLLKSNQAEQKILKDAMSSAKSENAKSQSQKRIDELKKEEEQTKKDIETYLANAAKLKEENKLTAQQIAAAPNKLDDRQTAAVENYVNENKTKDAAVALNNTVNTTQNQVSNSSSETSINQQNTTVANPTTSSTTANPTTTQSQATKPVETAVFKPESATKEEVAAASEKTFGVKTQADVVYKDETSKINANSARNAENEALNLHAQAEQKRKELAATTNTEQKKKLTQEIADLDKQAQEKMLMASENYFLANRAEYDRNQSLIQKAKVEGRLKTEPAVLTEVENNWLKALIVRDKVKASKDFNQKVTFINEAYQKERAVIAQQYEIINSAQVNAVVVSQTPIVKGDTSSSAQNKVEEKPLGAKVNEAFGVQETKYNYGKDENVQQALSTVNSIEEDAAKNYDEYKDLKEQATKTEKKSEAKKLNKEAIKKMKLARIKMKSAMAKRGELNDAEKNANALKIQEAIEKKGLVLTDKHKKELKSADDEFKKADELRAKAKKEKSFVKQTALNNEANALETKALERQKSVLKGKEDDSSILVKVTPADSVKAKNTALQADLKNNQASVDANQQKIAALQKEPLDAKQKEELNKLQNEVNALLTQSKEKEQEAATIKDVELSTATLNHAAELKKQAVNKQQQMLAIKDKPLVSAVAATKSDSASKANNVAANPVVGANPNATKKTPQATQEYAAILKDAQTIEKEIGTEVAKYTQLKKEAKGYQQQSEQALAKGDVKEAERLKKLADQKEEQALLSSQLIDNSRAEADAKRKEAQLYVQSLNQQVAKEVTTKSADKNTKTDVFADYKQIAQKAVNATPAPVNNTAKPTENNTPVAANNAGVNKIDVTQSPLFGGKSQDVQNAVIKDQFEIKAEVVYSAAQPIPVDAPMPEGLIYTVQVGAFRNPIPQDLFKGISPLFGEKTPMGFIRYTAGTFRSFKAASIAKDKIKQMGYPDAFVVPYYNGKRISMDQADAVTAKADVQQQNALKVIEAREVETISKVEVKNPVNTVQNTAAEVANRAPSSEVQPGGKMFYTVQIGVFSKEIKKGSVYDVQPLNVEKTTNGLLRYSVGKYSTLEEANKRKAELNAGGIADAFVTVYKNGQRISVADAQAAGGVANNATTNVNNNTTVNATATNNNAGITFKVQVGAYAKEVPVETTTLFFNLPAKVEYYKDANGITIFTVGNFTNVEEARKLKDQVLAAGLKDAFLVAYQGKEKISVDKALELLKK